MPEESTRSGRKVVHPYSVMPVYGISLSRGVLYVDGDLFLAGNRFVIEDKYGFADFEYKSPFLSFNFHKVLIGRQVHCLCEGCFNECRKLKEIVLSESVEVIEYPIADNTAVEYFNDDGLLFLGTENNPRHALMGCVQDYKSDRVVVPATTKVVADGYPWPEQVKEIQFPDGQIFKVNEEVADSATDYGDELPF